ncbi:pilus assembly protein [Herbaspirillum sp. AP02]|uniref:PilN domain-containing protein n=1 Tax=unclassified Herbaspirillum TaxID=2624150 RepID=UPI0015D9EB2B|nr:MULTISPECIES: pilus assembly protein [unclassified Herbaspirillum]MBG7620795.1 pilus assembly protein [Herbaspirillum sp. AP02]NZD68258.1 pilus assembly protein [Herbaspirillum sp. AP21]
MKPSFDFSRTPQQRRRQRERDFYRWLGAAALLGCLIAAVPGLRVWWHTSSLHQANALLTQELQTLAAQVQQTSALRARIDALNKQISAQEQLARRRQQAILLLRGAAQAGNPQTRLQRVVLQAERAELRGHATTAQAVQDYATALSGAGLDGATLNDLHAEEGGYAFSVVIPLAPSAASAIKEPK